MSAYTRCGTLLQHGAVEAGVPPKVVQKWLGHSTLEMTMNVTRTLMPKKNKKRR